MRYDRRQDFPALGTTATVVVTAPFSLDEAVHILAAELAAMDRTCNRFRADSEISRPHLAVGQMVTVRRYKRAFNSGSLDMNAELNQQSNHVDPNGVSVPPAPPATCASP